MYHIDLIKRLPNKNVTYETISVASIEEYNKRLDKIRKEYSEQEITMQELFDSILKNSRGTYEINLFQKIQDNHYKMIRHSRFYSNENIVNILKGY